jgi:hypothetical protein
MSNAALVVVLVLALALVVLGVGHVAVRMENREFGATTLGPETQMEAPAMLPAPEGR